MAAKWYELRLSVLDERGNTVRVPLNVCGASRKKDILKERALLNREIIAGKYDHYKNNSKKETLSADIEVHDDKTGELLWLE